MYVLTLNGAQMLFFSIVHTSPVLVLVVLVGIIALLLWALQSLFAVLFANYQIKIGVPRYVLSSFTALAALHLALLFSYEVWSYSGLRIVVCLLGVIAIGLLVVLSVIHLFRSGKAHAGI